MGSISPPPPPKSLPVLIVGAGPIGLALALDLAHRNIPTTILERKPPSPPQIEAKASVINERTMEYCHRLGIRDKIANSGFPHDLPGDTVFCTSMHNGKFIGRLEMPSARDREVPSESREMLQRCPQCWFDPILESAVVEKGLTEIRYGVQVTGVREEEDGVTVLARQVDGEEEEEFRAEYVVACDGPSSAVRKAVGIPFKGQDLGHTLSVIIEVDDIAANPPFGRPAERYLFISPDGTWGNFTTIDGRNLWRFSVVGMEGKIDPENLESFDMHSLVKKALGRDDIEFKLRKVLQWRRSQFTADRYAMKRIILAGDSAHTMSPTGGHGLNTGMGDVSDLSWMLQALLEGWGGKGLIDAYNTERRPVAIRNGLGSTRNFSVWKDGQGRDKVLDDGVEAEEQRRSIGEKMAANLRQEFQSLGIALGYNYAESPLVLPDCSPAPPDDAETYIQTARPGHRAPHCWLEDGSSTIDLFGRGFVLLRFGSELEGDDRLVNAARKVGFPLACVSIQSAEAANLYKRRLVLVRPDGMVAWRGDVLPESVEYMIDRVRGVCI